MSIKSIGIVGTGPASLMAGTVLAEYGFKVHFFDQKKAPGRKFLVAGHGGFNLTHGEPMDSFTQKYSHAFIREALQKFSNEDFIFFLKKIGIDTYTGSSGKIFPVKGVKPIEVLDAWINYLKSFNVIFSQEHKLIDFSKNSLSFENKGEIHNYTFDAIIFGLGGGSWAKTGSDGSWLTLFEKKNIPILPFGSSNSGFVFENWEIGSVHSGKTIKNILVFSTIASRKGDLVLTDYGIEGSPIYANNMAFRSGLDVYLDLKPDKSQTDVDSIMSKFQKSADGLKKLGLTSQAIQVIKAFTVKDEFLDPSRIAQKIKKLKLPIENLRPLDEVISTIGGVDMNALHSDFQLKMYDHIYCVGEMLDWDAPTGGYLIQAAVSSGYVAGNSLVNRYQCVVD